MESIGQRIQRLRKSAGLTQEELAEKLGITPQAVSKWENDVSAPDIGVLSELADILGVSCDTLLGKEPQMKFVEATERKDFDKMVLKMKVRSAQGDNVDMNLPLSLISILASNGLGGELKIGKETKIDGDMLKQVLNVVEQGMVGKVLDVTSADGDIVEIFVE